MEPTDKRIPTVEQWEALKEVIDGAGGGGIIELTSADYNYDLGSTGTNNCIAMWTLDAGIYSTKEGTAVIFNNAESVVTSQNSLITVSDSLFNSTEAKTFTSVSWISASAVYSYIYGITNATNGNYILPMESPLVRRREVSQSTGNNNALIMSQNATTSMVYADPSATSKIKIGINASSSSTNTVAIQQNATASGEYSIAVGRNSKAQGAHSVALGDYSIATTKGEFNISTLSEPNTSRTHGYNNTPYRLLTGLYDGQSDHDAATYGQVISYSAINGAGAPTTATEGKYVGQLYYDTTNEAMYFLKAIDTTTDPDTYTWEALGGGGGSGIIELTSADYNYPTENPDGVAVWKLDEGEYRAASNTKIYWTTGWYTEYPSLTVSARFAVTLTGALLISGMREVLIYGRYLNYFGDRTSLYSYTVNSAGTSSDGGQTQNKAFLLKEDNIVGNLTTSGTSNYNKVLRADQGKVLNDKIGGDLSNLTTTDKTSLINAINELTNRIEALENA